VWPLLQLLAPSYEVGASESTMMHDTHAIHLKKKKKKKLMMMIKMMLAIFSSMVHDLTLLTLGFERLLIP
jgi:hypothetical protein